MREWLDALPPVPRFLVLVGLVVLANLVVVAVACPIAGWTDAVGVSNALFYAAAAMLLLSVLVQWGNPEGRHAKDVRPTPEEGKEGEKKGDEPVRVGPRTDEVLEEMVRRRSRPFSRIAGILLVAGLILFGLSILVPTIWP